MTSGNSDWDGIYLDSEDIENRIVLRGGQYFLEHEHLTERGTLQAGDAPGEFRCEITLGDREGAPPYSILVESADESLVHDQLRTMLGGQFAGVYRMTCKGEPLLTNSGIFIRTSDPEELSEYDLESGDSDGGGSDAWMDDDSVAELIEVLDSKRSSDLLDAMKAMRNFGACDFSAAVPRLQELCEHKDGSVAALAKETLQGMQKKS